MNTPHPAPDSPENHGDQEVPHVTHAAHPSPATARVPSPFAPHSPRVKAALCYTVPLVPAVYLLAREERNRFLRLHAAQSLVFHGLVGGAQLTLFLALVILGGVIQSMTGALITAAILFVLFSMLLVVVAITWAHLVADCIRGQVALLPLVGAWAVWIEALTARAVRSHPEVRPAPPPAADSDLSDTPPPGG
jgi:uncharacterized membrane protein